MTSTRQIIRKITTGRQVTLPLEFIQNNDLSIGESVSMSLDERNLLIIKPYRDKRKALLRMEKLFNSIKEEFNDMNEEELIDLINKEKKK